MPRIYIANPTKQFQRISYRLDFNGEGQRNVNLRPNFKFTDVPPGRQAPVGGDLDHPMQVQEIVNQLKVYGAIDVSEVRSQRHFVTYIFSLDRPVPEPVIREVMAQNEGFQVEAGRQRRIAAALAANETLQSTVNETPPFTLEYEQDEQSEAGEKRIEEGYHVVADARPDAQPPKAVRGGARKKAA